MANNPNQQNPGGAQKPGGGKGETDREQETVRRPDEQPGQRPDKEREPQQGGRGGQGGQGGQGGMDRGNR